MEITQIFFREVLFKKAHHDHKNNKIKKNKCLKTELCSSAKGLGSDARPPSPGELGGGWLGWAGL